MGHPNEGLYQQKFKPQAQGPTRQGQQFQPQHGLCNPQADLAKQAAITLTEPLTTIPRIHIKPLYLKDHEGKFIYRGQGAYNTEPQAFRGNNLCDLYTEIMGLKDIIVMGETRYLGQEFMK